MQREGMVPSICNIMGLQVGAFSACAVKAVVQIMLICYHCHGRNKFIRSLQTDGPSIQ